jgi:fatty acid desaturase
LEINTISSHIDNKIINGGSCKIGVLTELSPLVVLVFVFVFVLLLVLLLVLLVLFWICTHLTLFSNIVFYGQAETQFMPDINRGLWQATHAVAMHEVQF